MESFELFVRLGVPILLLVVGYALGGWIENRHFQDIRRREAVLRPAIPTMTFETLPTGWMAEKSGLVSGSVVISLDYFKRFLASLRALVGGRIKSYEPLLDRARREAQLRMLESARDQGFDAVINVRLETSRLASSRGKGEGTAGREILAFGTGIVRRST